MKKTRVRESMEDRAFMAVTVVLLIAMLLVFAYPLYFVLIASISNPFAIYQGRVILYPVGILFDGYREIFSDSTIWQGYLNSILYTVGGILISLGATLPGAYALSRKDLVGRNIIMFFITLTMFFGGGLVPTFLVVQSLGLLNSPWAVLLTAAVSAWNLIIARTFFSQSIPDELLEAAQIDGCSNTRFFVSIVLPVSSALIAIMALYYGVSQWNSYFKELIYLDNRALYPLQLVLRNILVRNQLPPNMLSDFELAAKKQQMADLVKYGLIVVSSLPVMIAYPFVQKHFTRGVLVGSIKG